MPQKRNGWHIRMRSKKAFDTVCLIASPTGMEPDQSLKLLASASWQVAAIIG